MKQYGVVLAAAVMLASAAHAGEREGCRLCGMYIDQYQGTSANVTSKDGRVEKTCGGADMLRLVADAGGVESFASVLVHDWLSGKEITAAGATYVIGSDLVPDMIPNIIAFGDQDGAKKFISEHGGQELTFSQALLAVSPMGMTMPSRVNSAVPPPKGSVSGGAGYMGMVKDDLMMGSNKVSAAEFLTRTGGLSPMPMIPKKMEASGPMLMANYGITDRLSATAKISDLDKIMTSTMRTSSVERVTKHKGITDLELKAIYNLWRDDYYSKFFSLMGNMTLPTGDFDTTFRTMPGLQLGTGSVNLGGGLLGSARFGDFWLHGEVSYLVNRENGDDYKFGDVGKVGAAIIPTSFELAGLLGPIMIAGSLSTVSLVKSQTNIWFILLQPVAFIIYIICATAEVNRTPFDIPEAESELVAGYFTEYSGMKFGMFYFAEYSL